jgi:hypothetical protein
MIPFPLFTDDIQPCSVSQAEDAALAYVTSLNLRERELIAREQALEARERDLAARMQAMADVVMRSGYGVPSRPSLESFSPLVTPAGLTKAASELAKE